MKTVEEQFVEISATFCGATLTPAGGGMYLVRIPNVPLPEGWSQPSTEIRFVAPNGYCMQRRTAFGQIWLCVYAAVMPKTRP